MTIERNPTPPAEHSPTPIVGSAAPGSSPTPLQIRLQILSTEHWSLLSSRSLAWNESFSRAGMYLSTLSGSLVALGLIGGVDGFSDAFFVVALIVLPVVLFVGIGTWFRMGATNYHDVIAIAGMNRIRAAYLEIAPELAPYFVMGVHDDAAGVGLTMAVPPETSPFAHLIAGTPTLVMVLNGVVSGAIVGIALLRIVRADPTVALVAALVAAIAITAAQFQSARGKIRRGQRAMRPMFPTPPTDRPGA